MKFRRHLRHVLQPGPFRTATRSGNSRRPPTFELLEKRALLAGGGLTTAFWQNPSNHADVNNDSRVTPLDALMVINDLNARGARTLPSGTLQSTGGSFSTNSFKISFLDVNGDGRVAPNDALMVVNALNDPGPSVRIRLVTRDINGVLTDTIPEGQQFILEARVQDLRNVNPTGVYSAYLDVNYDSTRISVDQGTEVDHKAPYLNGEFSDLSTPGLIDDTGSFDGDQPKDDTEVAIWSLVMRAESAGTAVIFDADPADLPAHEVLLYGENIDIPDSQIDYVDAVLNITSGGPPLVSINDVSVVEGTGGSNSASFNVTLSAPPTETVTVAFTTNNGTATAPGDFAATSGTLTFTAGTQTLTQNVLVPIVTDAFEEGNEQFTVTLSNIVGGVAGDTTGTGTILNDDGIPTLSINDVTVTEGNLGSITADFTVTLSTAPGAGTVSVGFATSNGTATVNQDYIARSGFLTFTGNETSKTVSVTVIGDVLDEANETFFVTLASPSGATIGKGVGLGTITDDDATPTAAISDASVSEGNTGTQNMTFTVSLSAPSGRITFVNFSTADGTATSPTDYDAKNGAVTFLPGETSKPIDIVIKGDTAQEGDENFVVNLSNPTDLVLGDFQELGTIIDDDGAPILSITNAQVTEGNSGTQIMNFAVNLSNASGLPVTVVVNTQSGTATSPADFLAITNTTLTFAPGDTTETVAVTINGDVLDEANETFNVVLSQASQATIPAGQGVGTGTILDNDPTPTVAIDDVTVSEGNSGTVPATFTVTLSAVSGQQVLVGYATQNGTAVSPADFVAQNNTLTFEPGTTTQTITIDVNGDTSDEIDEDFFVNLISFSNATASDGQGRGRILDDDSEPSLSISGVSVPEGNSGTSIATFVVTLSAASGKPVTVNFATANGTAVAPQDYDSQIGALTFEPGATTKTINVVIKGDTEDEGTESFVVNLSGASNATIGNGEATGTILNDDRLPTLSITDVTVNEGDTGSVNAVFTVTLSEAAATQVTVGFATADNTAKVADGDYVQASGDLTFVVGETSKTITVSVLGDVIREIDETFFVNLSSAVGAAITDAQGIGTILDNEIERISIRDAVVVERDAETVNAIFTVTLSVAINAPVTVAFATQNGTATAGPDYEATSGTLTFAPNVTSQTIVVPIFGDNIIEGNETFTVNLSNPSGAAIADGEGLGTIVDDDSDLPDKVRIRLAVTDLQGNAVTSLDPGEGFLLQAFVQDIRPPQNTDPRGVAQAFLDVFFNDTIIDVTGPITYGPNYPNAQDGTVIDDQIDEVGALDGFTPLGPTERLLFSIPMQAVASGLANFTADPADDEDHEILVFGEGTAVLPNQVDYVGTSVPIGSNAISIDDVSVTEGNAGSQTVTFTITRFLPDGGTSTVAFATSNGTAAAVQDYLSTSGVVTFTGSETTKTVSVTVLGDVLFENDETFFVDLSSVTGGATISDARGTGTIINDDVAPSVSIADAVGAEGTTLSFVVTLSTASGRPTTVVFATENSTTGTPATAGTDYTSTTGTLTFAAGVTTQTIGVAALTDTLTETAETFQVRLSNPSGTSLADATALGTITNVVPPPPSRISGFVYVDTFNDGFRATGEAGIQGVLITLRNEATGVETTTLTGADGSYVFSPVTPGTYSVRETHPSFFADGADTPGTPRPTGAIANDRFNGIVMAAGASATNFNFGELGLRSPFVAAFFNRRAFMASSLFTGPNGPNPGTQDLDLTRGAVWISFDAGWSGQRTFNASFLGNQGSVTMTLYDVNLTRLTGSTPGGTTLVWNGAAGVPYFLKVEGTNPNVDLTFTDTAITTTGSGGTTPTTPPPITRLMTASTSSTSTDPFTYVTYDADFLLAATAGSSKTSTTQAATDSALADDDWMLDGIWAA